MPPRKKVVRPLGWIDMGDGLETPDCMKCINVMTHELFGACASVGMEHGKSTDQMMRQFLISYHARGHVDIRGKE